MVDGSSSPLEFGWAPIHWDTKLRVRKTLMTSPFDVAIVGEAFNLLNLNASDKDEPTRVVTSPTLRVGTVLGF